MRSTAALDLADLQGNILYGYRSLRHGRFLFFTYETAQAGRDFLGRLLPLVTTARQHAHRAAQNGKLDCAVNVALSFAGLAALGLPRESLVSFPAPFQDGMRARAASLGDTGDEAPQNWDPPWRDGVPLLVMVYGRTPDEVEAQCDAILRAAPGGVAQLGPAQDVAVLPSPDGQRREHFGFVDGLSNPAVEGFARDRDAGNPDDRGGFRPVALGEFILGYPDEGHETSEMPLPHLLGRNGTFLVARKLHQHVARFRRYVAEQAKLMACILPQADQDNVTAQDYVAAKMIGRWKDGTSLVRSPANAHAGDQMNSFGYGDDPEGARCPLGAHVRRAYPRDALGFGAIVARRRLIRRGIPYGELLADGQFEDDRQPRGIMFLAYNASIERQFEFVQQQWINAGDEFEQGNLVDPITGSPRGPNRLMIAGDARDGRPPFLCHGMPRFVSTRGGEYFFVPGLTALRLMASGEVVVA